MHKYPRVRNAPIDYSPSPRRHAWAIRLGVLTISLMVVSYGIAPGVSLLLLASHQPRVQTVRTYRSGIGTLAVWPSIQRSGIGKGMQRPDFHLRLGPVRQYFEQGDYRGAQFNGRSTQQIRQATTSEFVGLQECESNAPGWDVEPIMRIGHGFDIHRMAPRDDPEVGGPVIIGGVTFDDFDLGIIAHSDGDIVYHSVVDALFGALCLPDIGQFFPDTDPRWKGAASDVFMGEAWRQMNKRGYRVGNIDVTIIAQAPRMMVKSHPLAKPGEPFDHKVQMMKNIAELLKCPQARVNVKARTHEKVDAVGEKRAVSCHVVAILERIPETTAPATQ